MTTVVLATLAAAVLIGVTLGGLGGGGSILTLPVLVYVTGVPLDGAVTMSLIVVGVTAAVALVPHARAGHVRWRTGLPFAAAGMIGAYAGGRLAAHVPAQLLLTGFAVLMVLTAAAMLRPRHRAASADPAHRPRVPLIVAAGLGVGLATGLLGAGGGFLIVPALAILAAMPMPAAVGTSLLVIAANSTAGIAGHLHTTTVDWPLTAAITALAVAGSVAGTHLAGKANPTVLRRAFGCFVIVAGAGVLARQLLT
ncbi:sulfite exporter TauE/SafE family protein [Longispora sp. NPDC051575]|uniref:sulfite exporter TauE/SafE family protein n=1 Tax=Longispora sp. NPDC051575 TaxID=3154943 RepID=UPI003423C040